MRRWGVRASPGVSVWALQRAARPPSRSPPRHVLRSFQDPGKMTQCFPEGSGIPSVASRGWTRLGGNSSWRREQTPCRSVVSDRARVPVSRHAAAAVTRCCDSCRVRTKPVSLSVPGRHAVCTFPSGPEMWKPWVFGSGSHGEGHSSPFRKGRVGAGRIHTPAQKSQKYCPPRPSVVHPPAFCLPSLTPAPLGLAKFSYS